MRLLVCGPRHWKNRRFIWERLDEIKDQITTLISGGAPGVDSFAEVWACRNGIPPDIYPANWDRDGKYAAGPLRNRRMLKEGTPDKVLAFTFAEYPTSGTSDMIDAAQEAQVPVERIKLPVQAALTKVL